MGAEIGEESYSSATFTNPPQIEIWAHTVFSSKAVLSPYEGLGAIFFLQKLKPEIT